MSQGPISQFIEHHYRHFNAAALKDAAHSYSAHLEKGGSMFMTIAGAMSTAELGLSLAEMIRQDKVHAICCTGANLEEDVFNLVAHDYYERVPNYRDLTAADEVALLDRHMNRVTDTCIPEMEAMRRIENVILKEWMDADARGERLFPHEFFWRILGSKELQVELQAPLKDIPAELAAYHLELSEDGLRLTYRFDARREGTGIPDLMRQLATSGLDFRDLQTKQSSLEDIFVTLVSDRT